MCRPSSPSFFRADWQSSSSVSGWNWRMAIFSTSTGRALRGEAPGPLAILSHGLEGSAANGYMRGMAAAFNAAGWDALAWDFRGCGIEPNRLLRFYHSGETRDLAAVIRHASAKYARIALVGFSLGGNMTLKYMGEAPPRIPAVACAVGDFRAGRSRGLRAGARPPLEQPHFTLGRFLKTLIAKRSRPKAPLFPG